MHRVVEQVTDPYDSKCDECPLPGAVRIRYDDHTREQTFFDTGGKAILQRVVALERHGSIASIRFQRSAGTRTADAPDLYRVMDSITIPGGERVVTTIWDDHDNWTEK
jgi:hypothetical protein